jgi:hypothetical protein
MARNRSSSSSSPSRGRRRQRSRSPILPQSLLNSEVENLNDNLRILERSSRTLQESTQAYLNSISFRPIFDDSVLETPGARAAMERDYPRFSEDAQELMLSLYSVHRSIREVYRIRGEEAVRFEDIVPNLRGSGGDAGMIEEDGDEGSDGGVIVEGDQEPKVTQGKEKAPRKVHFASTPDSSNETPEPKTPAEPNPTKGTQTSMPVVQADMSKLNLDFNNRRQANNRIPAPLPPGGRPKANNPEARHLRRTSRFTGRGADSEVDAASHITTYHEPNTTATLRAPKSPTKALGDTSNTRVPQSEPGFRTSLEESIAYHRIRRGGFEMEIKQPASAPPPVVHLDTGRSPGTHETVVRGMGLRAGVVEGDRRNQERDDLTRGDLRRLRFGGGVVDEAPAMSAMPRMPEMPRMPVAPGTPAAPRTPHVEAYMSQEMGVSRRGRRTERTEAVRERRKDKGKVSRKGIREV